MILHLCDICELKIGGQNVHRIRSIIQTPGTIDELACGDNEICQACADAIRVNMVEAIPEKLRHKMATREDSLREKTMSA